MDPAKTLPLDRVAFRCWDRQAVSWAGDVDIIKTLRMSIAVVIIASTADHRPPFTTVLFLLNIVVNSQTYYWF